MQQLSNKSNYVAAVKRGFSMRWMEISMEMAVTVRGEWQKMLFNSYSIQHQANM